MSRDLRIAVIDKNPLRAAIIEEGLRAAHVSVVRIDDTAELLDRIRAIDPDVILIDLESPSRDVLEQMFKVSVRSRGPSPCSSTGPMPESRPISSTASARTA